jgi:hypothetical protein
MYRTAAHGGTMKEQSIAGFCKEKPQHEQSQNSCQQLTG